MAPSRFWSFVLAAIAACLILRVFGVFRDWLPSAGALAIVLAAGHLLMARPWERVTLRRSDVERHAFAIGLVVIALVTLATRLPGLYTDLGHVPLDMDEERFGGSVKRYFVTGVLGHETVEDYPGVVFWMFAAASFLAYLRGIVSGTRALPAEIPVEMFVGAARTANVFAAVGMSIATA